MPEETTQTGVKSKAEMLIRKPVAEVFEAFIDPGITTQFWFTKGSGRLVSGADIQWDWEMYQVSVTIHVKIIEPNKRIAIEWPSYGGDTIVEWRFIPQADNTTFVSISESGFSSSDQTELINQVVSSTEGFTLVLAGLKALLEHHIRLNLVPDRFPAGLQTS